MIQMLTLLLGIVLPLHPALAPSPDADVLRQAQVGMDAPALLAFFERFLPNQQQQEQIDALVRQLAARSFRDREKASKALVQHGVGALRSLRKAASAKDPEVVRRAKTCIEQIEDACTPAVILAASRRLALLRPTQTCKTLLAILPHLENEQVLRDMVDVLASVAVYQGKADTALLGALGDREPLRRSAAVAALARANATPHRARLAALLKDRELKVRWVAALHLARWGDKDSIPVLLEGLRQLPRDQSWEGEEILLTLAQEKAPSLPANADAKTLEKYHADWAAWWKDNAGKVELKVLAQVQPTLGFTLCVLMNKGEIVELDRDGKPRWKISGIGNPLDAEILPGERVLIAEYDARRVTERNFKGVILWEKQFTEPPTRVQRMSDGRVMVTSRSWIRYVDRAGRETEIYRSQVELVSARRFRNGDVGLVLAGNRFIVLDSTGKEKQTLPAQGVQIVSCLDVLPNGHYIVANYGGDKVIEYDRQGKPVWEASVASPLSPVRLSNGNTLVSSQDNFWAEYDRQGKQVKQFQITGHPTQVRRR